jgi:hypothetical protein
VSFSRAFVTAQVLAVAVLLFPLSGHAAGKKRSEPAPQPAIQKVIELDPIAQVQIEMPDQSLHDFGPDFQAALETGFTQSGQYIVQEAASSEARVAAAEPGGIVWTGSATATARIHIDVTALTFQSGLRGDRMFYGFNERLNTPFNTQNEFPLRLFGNNWFDHTFDIEGSAPFDSASGLDLGEGLDINLLFAWLALKYSTYRSELGLKITVQSPLLAQPRIKQVRVRGSGFFYDLVGGYEQYSGGIMIARTDAIGQAFQKALNGAYASVAAAVADLPLLASVDSVLNNGTILLGTGLDSPVSLGTEFVSTSDPSLVLQVTEQSESGSVTQLVSGNLSQVTAGMVFEQAGATPTQTSDPTLSAEGEGVDLPAENIPQADLGDQAPNQSLFSAWLQSLTDTIFLPYRIYRYFSYDQAYHLAADGETSGGLPSSNGPIVAVIDSGVDYNHPLIHPSLWLNPAPIRDGDGQLDRYGWDFISGDSRPYDDGYHGTEIASALLARAPGARIMPLKVFNPWGITSSAAIDQAFVYAVDHGAQVILCAWATEVDSQALEAGVEYARAQNVAVVAAAGDLGRDLDQVPEYPASLASREPNLLAVTAADAQGNPIASANSGPETVALAVSAENVVVALPRLGSGHVTSSGVAAAIAAGELLQRADGRVGVDAVNALLSSVESRSTLDASVRGGAFLP